MKKAFNIKKQQMLSKNIRLNVQQQAIVNKYIKYSIARSDVSEAHGTLHHYLQNKFSFSNPHTLRSIILSHVVITYMKAFNSRPKKWLKFSCLQLGEESKVLHERLHAFRDQFVAHSDLKTISDFTFGGKHNSQGHGKPCFPLDESFDSILERHLWTIQGKISELADTVREEISNIEGVNLDYIHEVIKVENELILKSTTKNL
ncbi:hypothetical protein DA717_08770 [Piscirickettsiaceae bacterium NZ-RLO2]|nr:hypothetical protein DA717_08770 [Piscirickettsiaceae bacterium NZ-RLO2]